MTSYVSGSYMHFAPPSPKLLTDILAELVQEWHCLAPGEQIWMLSFIKAGEGGGPLGRKKKGEMKERKAEKC